MSEIKTASEIKLTSEIKITIGGMSCGHCIGRVKKAIDALTGVEGSTVEVGSAVVRINNAKTTQKAVEEAVKGAGYEVKTPEH
ncbi:heavy-metal-associated domain-containing protein [Candidatus Magnetominusculus dajiuhuensis]|uniref:heavy-metal-associated domain-containing protein n=1 Tax=Candidatus Magnetominusculus dajiuhuensis TaxID=3137712 RepID=UPI003B42EBD8